jgi:hypothetical protein
MKKSRTRKKIIKKNKRSSKKDGVKVEYIENGEQLESIFRDEVKHDTLTAKILDIVYKIIGKRVPIRKTNDGYILSYFIISFLLTYVVTEFYRHSSSVNTDILTTGVFSVSEFANVLPKVLTRSMKLQSDLVKCMTKKTFVSYVGSFIGYKSEKIDINSEISEIINTQVTFTKKEIENLIENIPKNYFNTDDFNIDEYINIDFESMKRKLFNKIDNSKSLITYNEDELYDENYSNYKSLKETCPDFFNPINEILFQELTNAVNSIKSRIKDEITIHKMTTTNKINEISYLSMISITTIILCIILFSKTFVIQKIAKCFKKPKTISRKPQLSPRSNRLSPRRSNRLSPRRSNRLIEKSNRLSPRRSQLIERKKSSSPY